jgi:hypothetical protein
MDVINRLSLDEWVGPLSKQRRFKYLSSTVTRDIRYLPKCSQDGPLRSSGETGLRMQVLYMLTPVVYEPG